MRISPRKSISQEASQEQLFLQENKSKCLIFLEIGISSAVHTEQKIFFLINSFFLLHVHWFTGFRNQNICFFSCYVVPQQILEYYKPSISFLSCDSLNLFTAITKWQTESNRLIIGLTYCKSPTMTNACELFFFFLSTNRNKSIT